MEGISVYYVYEITNKINNKKYIGKHTARLINNKYYGSGLAIKRAIKKYGKENFKKEINWLIKQELKSFSPKKWARAYFAFGLFKFLNE